MIDWLVHWFCLNAVLKKDICTSPSSTMYPSHWPSTLSSSSTLPPKTYSRHTILSSSLPSSNPSSSCRSGKVLKLKLFQSIFFSSSSYWFSLVMKAVSLCVCVWFGNDPKISLVVVFCSIANSSGYDWEEKSQILDRSPNLSWMCVTPFLDLIPSLLFLFSLNRELVQGVGKRTWDCYLLMWPFCTLRTTWGGEKPRIVLKWFQVVLEERETDTWSTQSPSSFTFLPSSQSSFKYYKKRLIDAPCLFLLSLFPYL